MTRDKLRRKEQTVKSEHINNQTVDKTSVQKLRGQYFRRTFKNSSILNELRPFAAFFPGFRQIKIRRTFLAKDFPDEYFSW